jgi:hypothetical protein
LSWHASDWQQLLEELLPRLIYQSTSVFVLLSGGVCVSLAEQQRMFRTFLLFPPEILCFLYSLPVFGKVGASASWALLPYVLEKEPLKIASAVHEIPVLI